MNLFQKFRVKEQLKLAVAAALIVWCVNSAFGEAEQTFLNAGGYTATTGGSISGSATIEADIATSCNEDGVDQVWTQHTQGTVDTWGLSLVGTGSHPITSSDVNYLAYTITFPAGTGYSESEGFTISCTNTALDYDKTGTLSVGSDCYASLAGPTSATVTITNTASVMNVAVLIGTLNYSGGDIAYGGGNQTLDLHIFRGTGDTYNTRTVYFTVSGTAVSGTDYTGVSSGNNSVTIPAGTNGVVIPITALLNPNIVGVRTLNVTLTGGMYQISTNNTAFIDIIQEVPSVAVVSGTNYYSSDYIIRGEGSQTANIQIYRADTLSQQTVHYAVGGNAVSGTDYTPSLSGSATINAGTNLVNIPITAVANASIIGTRILTVTLTNDFYPIAINTATLGIIQDVPTFDITAPYYWASPNSNYIGQFTITRAGGMSNSVTAQLAISGTAPATDYTTLPTHVTFGVNQASTNLIVYALNQSLATNETVVLSLIPNSAYQSGITTDAVVTLIPNSASTNSVVSPQGEYWRGSGTDPTYWSIVVPLNFETGTVYSNVDGNCSNLYSGLTSWNSAMYYHYNASNSAPQNVPANRIPFNNPIVAFGERVGGTPLYYNQAYQFGIYGGDPTWSNTPIVIQAYYRTNYQLAGTVNIIVPYTTNGWNNYTTNGFQVTTNAYGLTTILTYAEVYQYGASSSGACFLTHTASDQATNYYYVVGVEGYPADGSTPMAMDGSGNIQPSLLYSLEFESRPPWRSTFIDQPQFDGTPLPPFYDGMTLAEMMTNSPPVTNGVSFPISGATNLDDSPELRRSPILDNFVASMNNDPIALANFVINQIGLTDPMDYSDDGNVSEDSISLGGITRGALGTFLERQGSPYDQCALLIYLLRQAGVPAVYEFAPRNGLMMLDARLSQMLKFQVVGDINPAGVPYTTNTMIAVNYPWVAAYIGTNWVHIFPWIKDSEITQGLNLWEEMPTNYTDAYQWIRDYIYGNTNLLSLAVNGDNTPRVIFPAYLQQTLLQNHPGVSVDDIGTQIVNRQHYYASWGQFPTPTWVTNVSTPIESLSSSAITNVDPQLTNVFDTVSVEIQSEVDPTKDIKTGDMPLVELENREFYIYQFETNGNVELNLVLMPYRTNITTQLAFTNDPTLLDKEVLTMKFDQFDSTLNINFRYKRHKAITPSYPIDQGLAFLGLNTVGLGFPAEEIDFSRPLEVGDQAAICMDYGQVSTEMLNADAQSLWQMEQFLRANPTQTNSISPDVYEGELMYLAGMSYYEKCDEFSGFNQQVQSIDQLSEFSAGLSKIIPAHNGAGITNTDPVLPCVDMFSFSDAIAGNGTTTPASGQDYTMNIENYSWLEIADGSAEEHQVINRFYQQTNAVSTVRLLQLAQSSGAGIVPLTQFNYVSEGTTDFQGEQLQNWDPYVWQAVVSAFQNSSDVSAYITPGPMTNALYKGMAALVMSPYDYDAIISPSSLNGGFGSEYFPDNAISAMNAPNYDVYNDNDSYEAALTAPSPSQVTVAPDQTSIFDAPLIDSQISSGDYDVDPFDSTADTSAAGLLGMNTGTSDSDLGQDLETSAQDGNLGSPSFVSSLYSSIADPVRPLTGEFHINETDLQLPGPIPLALERNYSSQNLADNQFGYGWKLNIMPYLVISVKATNIYAADMDGSVLDYVRSTNSASTNMWMPTLAANPQLNNNTTAGVGSLANRLRDYIQLSVIGSITNYTLYGADGSVRIFQFMNFDSGTITNNRPYLTQWTDNRGNYYTFSYDTNSSDSDYGQMTRVKCSNGNYFNFDYDIYGHMVDAYTGDGRWIYYDYDEYGDLITVTLPDGSTRSYQYQLGTQAVTNSGVVTQEPYSTHLIIEEDKPDGRELLNAYDSQRRVTNQWSTAGSDLTPILTASFIYSNNFAITNSSTNTISGYTYVIDGNGNTNRYDYTNSLITKITDPLGHTIQQIWYPDNATSPGYPRSVQERIDKRGLVTTYLYDSNGDVTNTVFAGDLTGDGIVTQTATNTAIYNTNCLPLQMTDPIGNSIVTVYDPVFNFQPSQIIYYSDGTAISTNYMLYGDATNVVTDGNILQTNLAFGLNTRTIRAYASTDAATNDTFYDGQGFPTETVQYTGTGDPNITNYYFYNERGLVVDETDAVGAVTFYDYDPMNRPTEKQNIDEFGNTLFLTTCYYNENGETNWTDGPQYNPDDYIYYDYDGAGRLTTKIQWLSQANSTGTGVEQASGYNLYAQTFYEYDPLGNLLLMVDPRGAMTTNSYNALCQLVQSTHLDTNGVTVLSTDGYSYEPGGEVQSHTNSLGGVSTMYYNIMGKPEYQINPDGSTNGWRYYLDGRIYKQIQGNGAYWQTTYDDLNRITTRVFYSAAGVPEATNMVYLDRRGNTIQTVDAGFNIFNTTYDGLNRIKNTTGPAIVTVTEQETINFVASYVTNVMEHSLTYFYDAAGRFVTTSNALGQLTVNQFDAIGRPLSTKYYSPLGPLVNETYTSYSSDNNNVTVTNGSGPNPIVKTAYVDTEGHTVLSIAYPSSGMTEFTENQYDLAGNLIGTQHDSSSGGTVTIWTTASYTFDGLNRVTSTTDRNNALTTYAYDQLSDLTNRTMPGGLQWQVTYDNAGQMLSDQISGGGQTTRSNAYTYYQSGSPFVGMLDTKIDGRGLASTYSYDDWLRPASITRANPNYNQLDTYYSYDARGYTTNITEQYTGAVGGNDPKVILRSYDPYGQLNSESVIVNGASFSTASQSWDSAGRRTGLNINGANYMYGWNPDGTLTYASSPNGSGFYSYDTAGLLTNRIVGSRTTSITSRDGEGRPLTDITSVYGTPELTENMAWNGDGTLSSHVLDRPDFTDTRLYSYNSLSRRLGYEQLNVNGSTTWTNDFLYDSGTEGGIGVLTEMGQPGSALWNGGVSPFERVNAETNTCTSYPATGRLNGQATLTVTLDGQPLSVTTNSAGSPSYPFGWRVVMELTPGTHQLKAAALQPSGAFTAWATNTFTNNFGNETDAISRDGNGNVDERTWYNSDGSVEHRQFFYWDTKNRLTDLFDYDSNENGYYLHMEYDGLDRRLFTECYPTVNGETQIYGVTPTTINQYYDPMAEFQELGVSYGNTTEWKLYGPDLNGQYGGENGTGGFDGVSPGLNLFYPTISDFRGNILGEVTNGVIAWNSARPTGYGAVPGYRPVALGHGADVVQSSAWRGHWVDITGYYNIGERLYDPVAGMWLSYDPTWNESDPNYLSFAGGDPINGFDPDGRIATSFYNEADLDVSSFFSAAMLNGVANTTYNLGATTVNGVVQAGEIGDDMVGQTETGISDSILGTDYEQYFQGYSQLYQSIYNNPSSGPTSGQILTGTANTELNVATLGLYGMGQAIGTTAATGDYTQLQSASLSSLLLSATMGMQWVQPATSEGGLVHLTDEAGAAGISQSGTIVGENGIYAGPASNAGLTGWSVTAQTGLSPGTYTAIPIPGAAAEAFESPVSTGPITAWQNANGVQFTPPGSLNLTTGTFTPSGGVNWGQLTFQLIDSGISGGAAAGATSPH